MTDQSTVDITVVGAIAIDEIHSQAGNLDQTLGGSAVYASLAASMLAHVAPISVIGSDLDSNLLQPLIDRNVSLDGIERVDGPNFRWGCRYSPDGDLRETLYTHAGVYDTHPITLTESVRHAPYVLLTAGNPDQNHRAMQQMIAPKTVAIDTIEREVADRRDEFRDLLHYADIVSINTLEAAHLIEWPNSLNHPELPLTAWREIRALGPSVFILKRASQGIEIFEDGRHTTISAVPNVRPIDPTGAGDTFISALLSALARGQDLTQAAIWGCAAASLTIEQFGTQGIQEATPQAIAARTHLITVNSAHARAQFPATS